MVRAETGLWLRGFRRVVWVEKILDKKLWGLTIKQMGRRDVKNVNIFP